MTNTFILNRIMTCYQKQWNLYVATFLMKALTKDEHGKILHEELYLAVELFQFDNPEEAYNEIIKIIEDKSFSDTYREKENIVELRNLGLHELELLQSNIDQIKEELERKGSNYGINITSFRLKRSNLKEHKLVSKKEDLKLFDDYYNFKGDSQ